MEDAKKTYPMAGNFPVDQYTIDHLNVETGELVFTKRISQQDRYLNTAGQELPDPRPAAPTLGKKPEMHIRDYIRTLVHSERLQQDLDAAGQDTFEEANDFEVGDDYFPDSQYENDMEPDVAELIREGTASLSAKARAQEVSDARRKAAGGRTNELASDPPEPKKSPRKARKGLADEAEGESYGDQDAD